jgi:serine/threonine-protein kinase
MMMTSVLIQPPSASSGEVLELAPDQTLRFGRAPGGPDQLSHPQAGISRLAGEITSRGTHWTLTNLSRTATYLVENPEGAGEHVKVRARRIAAPIPFEISRVVIPAGHDLVSFSVFAPWQPYHEEPVAELPGSATTRAFPMDESAKYFLVLVALCEPRLRDESIAIPSDQEVTHRLTPLPGCAELSVGAVNFHLDYLARHKLRLRPPDGEGDHGRDPRREQIVSLALRFDLVREEHLALLPPRHAGRGRRP